MQTASIKLMTPISDIADTISFGLVGKIRKKTHSSDKNIVQTVTSNDACMKNYKRFDSLASLTKSKPQSSACEPSGKVAAMEQKVGSSTRPLLNMDFGLIGDLQRHNTITAAYNFNGSIINSDINDYQKNLQLRRSQSVQHLKQPIPHPNHSSKSSKFCCPIERKIFKKNLNDSSNSKSKKCDSSLNKNKNARKVTISNDTTDLESGEIVSTISSTINQSTLNSKNSSIYKHSVPVKTLPRYYNIDQMDTITNEMENSSLYSLNSGQPQFKLILDDHIVPGIPSVDESDFKDLINR